MLTKLCDGLFAALELKHNYLIILVWALNAMITPGPLPRPRQLPRVPPVRGRDSARHHVSPRPRLERRHEHVRLGGQRRLRHQQVGPGSKDYSHGHHSYHVPGL